MSNWKKSEGEQIDMSLKAMADELARMVPLSGPAQVVATEAAQFIMTLCKQRNFHPYVGPFIIAYLAAQALHGRLLDHYEEIAAEHGVSSHMARGMASHLLEDLAKQISATLERHPYKKLNPDEDNLTDIKDHINQHADGLSAEFISGSDGRSRKKT